MRVLFVTNGLGFGGAERIVSVLARGLVRLGDEVEVVATTRGGPIEDELRSAGITTHVLGIQSAFDVSIPLRLARIAARFRPDVVHSHLAVSDIAVAMAPLFAPRVTTVHNPGVGLGRAKKALWLPALLRFDRVVAVSACVRDALPSRWSIEVDRPSLVDARVEPFERDDARRTLGIGREERVVLSVGRFARVKGFDVLAQARTRLRQVRTILIGQGPDVEGLDGLEIVGARSDAPRLLAAADVVVCPSRSEGFPQVPLEAAWARRPVVATRVGGQAEAVVDGRTGLLVGPEDPIALADAIQRLIENPSEAQTLGMQGRERIEREGLTADAMVLRARSRYEAARSTPKH